MIQTAGNESQDPNVQKVAQQVSQTDLVQEQLRKNQWSSFYIAKGIATAASVILQEVSDMLKIASSMTNTSASATLASGQATLAGAEATEVSTFAAGAIGLTATGVGSYRMSQKSPERKDLDDKHEQLTRELKGERVGITTANRASRPPRSREEIKFDIDVTNTKIQDEQTKQQMYTQVPGQIGEVFSKMMDSTGNVAQGMTQMEAQADQAIGEIAKTLAQNAQSNVQTTLQMLQVTRSVPYNEPMKATWSG